LYVLNKLYELPEQICIHVKQILQITRTKRLYVSNKSYALSKQIYIYTYGTMPNKIFVHTEEVRQINEGSEHIMITFRTTYYYSQNIFVCHIEQTNEVSK
jgi:hypothetical protein